jgi:hypothetical protein
MRDWWLRTRAGWPMPTNDRAERNHAPLGWIAREKSEMPDDQPFGKELFWRSAAVVREHFEDLPEIANWTWTDR